MCFPPQSDNRGYVTELPVFNQRTGGRQPDSSRLLPGAVRGLFFPSSEERRNKQAERRIIVQFLLDLCQPMRRVLGFITVHSRRKIYCFSIFYVDQEGKTDEAEATG